MKLLQQLRAAHRRRREETGASLVIVLVFVAVFGLILTGLLTESSASVRFTSNVHNYQAKVYAADAGVSLGIQQIRQNNDICPEVGVPGTPIPDLHLPGGGATPAQTAKITCEVTTGQTWGGAGFAVITTSTDDNSFSTFGATSQTIRLKGPVYVNGGADFGSSSPQLHVSEGNMYQRKNCKPGFKPEDPYQYDCVTARPLPVPPHTAPSPIPASVPASASPTYNPPGQCRVFHPGRYTSPPNLVTKQGNQEGYNYFASGVYYFDFANPNDVFTVKQAYVLGGQPTSFDQQNRQLPIDAPSCAQSDPNAPGVSGHGVLFAFGGTSRMYVDQDGHVELFARTEATPPPAGVTAGADKMSIVAVPDTWPAGWAKSTAHTKGPLLDVHDGSSANFVTHGLVYAPSQNIALKTTNGAIAQALHGIVASKVQLKASGSGNGLAVSIPKGVPNPRHVRITATTVATGGEHPARSVAVVQVANDAHRTITIESWRTRSKNDLN